MPPAHRHFTFEEYLTLEEVSTVKHEFLDGQVWAMAGGSLDHGALAANVIGLLTAQLRGRPCRVLTSNVRIRVKATGLATYPDASVVCDEQQTDPDDPKGETLINPSVIVEVLSPATESYDRGEKLGHYKQIPTLREVLLVAEEVPRIEHWRREGDHWTLEVSRAGEAAVVASSGCELPVSQVYRIP